MPIALKDKLRRELDRMKRLDIIEEVPISESSEWVISLFIVAKTNGKLRICLDLSDLSKATKRHHHHLPTTEVILSKLCNGNVFTKLDASYRYWQTPVYAESSKLLTFNTSSGRHCYKTMPYGLHSASEGFQGTISNIFCGIENAENSQDDIIVWRKDVHLHNETLKNVFEKIRSHGLKLNKSNSQIAVNEIVFLENLISRNGIKTDPENIHATQIYLSQLTKPSCKSFLGC